MIGGGRRRFDEEESASMSTIAPLHDEEIHAAFFRNDRESACQVVNGLFRNRSVFRRAVGRKLGRLVY
jgi:hypothetical protein